MDRIPEVRTVRKKIALLSEQEQANSWSAELCAQWMGEDPEKAAVLYVDGHVRVYHGHQTRLPRHYVARQKLCLRATTDDRINDMDGQPFFLLNQAVDPRMLQVLENEIVPRPEREIPDRPTPEQLEADATLHRFILVFDREGYGVVSATEWCHHLADSGQVGALSSRSEATNVFLNRKAGVIEPIRTFGFHSGGDRFSSADPHQSPFWIKAVGLPLAEETPGP